MRCHEIFVSLSELDKFHKSKYPVSVIEWEKRIGRRSKREELREGLNIVSLTFSNHRTTVLQLSRIILLLINKNET